MGIFFRDYESAGSGIAKNAPKKTGAALFFDILFRKLWLITGVNMLYYIFFIPLVIAFAVLSFVQNYTAVIVTIAAMLVIFAVNIGPATTALMRIMRSFVIQRHTFVIRDFFRAYRRNFKKGAALGLLSVLIYVSAAASLYVYPQLAAGSGSRIWYLPMIITLSLSIVVTLMSFYAYLMLTATDLSLKDLIKNSFALAFVALKTNLIALLIVAVILVGMLFMLLYATPLFMLVTPFMPAALMGFIVCFLCYPVIQKYVINPYYTSIGQINPELLDAGDEIDEEAVFEDMGGKEKPIEKRKKGRGKRIS